eukprot:2996952-Rhodomonas_salina.1
MSAHQGSTQKTPRQASSSLGPWCREFIVSSLDTALENQRHEPQCAAEATAEAGLGGWVRRLRRGEA